LAFKVTMVSSDVANESHEGSLLFLKSCIRIFNDLNHASISNFTFTSYGLGFGGFGLSSYGDGGFGFSLGEGSMLFK